MTKDPCLPLDDYLDGVMPPERARSFARHLDQCDACRRAVKFERTLERAVRQTFDQIDAPDDVAHQIQRAMRNWRRRRQLIWLTGSLTALAAATLLTFSIRDWRRTPAHSVPIPPGALVDGAPLARLPLAIDDPPTARQDVEEVRPRTTVRLRSVDRPKQVAVLLPTRSKRVTMVMLYPTITPTDAGEESQAERSAADNKTYTTILHRGLRP